MRTTDVVVIGAGPAGAATAALLSRRGYDVLCVDRSCFPRDKACAEYCSPGVAEVLDRIGAWPQVVPHVKAIDGMNIVIDGRAVLPIRYSRGGRPIYGFTIPRLDLDLRLVQWARSCGAHVQEAVTIAGAVRRGSWFEITIRSRDGEERTIRTRIVAAADGLNSKTARLLGSTRTSRWPNRIGLIAHCESPLPLESVGEMHVAHGIYCGLAPLPGGLLNVGLVMSRGLARRRPQGLSLLEWGLQQLPVAAARLNESPIRKRLRGVVGMSQTVDRSAGIGFLLVGDAAGFFDPFTGEGIFRALRGAELASHSIDDAFRNQSCSAMHDLSQYEKLRRREFTSKSSLTGLIQTAMTQPPAFSRICNVIERSPILAEQLGNVLGDTVSATSLLVTALKGPILKHHQSGIGS